MQGSTASGTSGSSEAHDWIYQQRGNDGKERRLRLYDDASVATPGNSLTGRRRAHALQIALLKRCPEACTDGR